MRIEEGVLKRKGHSSLVLSMRPHCCTNDTSKEGTLYLQGTDGGKIAVTSFLKGSPTKAVFLGNRLPFQALSGSL